MSTTKNAAAIEAAESKITEAEAKHAAALVEASTTEDNVNKAEAELKRIEQCIGTNDPTAGLEDLTKADTEHRFFKLQLQAKTRAAVKAGGAVRTARTGLIWHGLRPGSTALQWTD
jgi:rRNA maturation endonuclease Nob1